MLPLLLVPALLLAAPAKPSWVTTLPEFPGKVYGIGVASATNTRALAMQKASDDARVDVLKRLGVTIQADDTIHTGYRQDLAVTAKGRTETASKSTDRQSMVVIHVQATDIPGLSVETTYLDEAGPSPTVYALAYLDVTVATREVQARYDTVVANLGSDTGDDLRAKIHRTRVIKTALDDLGRLEDLYALIRTAGADASLGEAITKVRLKTEREREDLRRALTFGMPPNPEVPVNDDVRGTVRTAFLNEGLGWSDHNPDLAVAMRVRTAQNGVQVGPRRWWDYNRSADFIIAQGTISLTLVDAQGQEYESTIVEAKGVGTTEFQAETQLLKDYKQKLTKTVGTWLADLGK
jgi:hypothetical protein